MQTVNILVYIYIYIYIYIWVIYKSDTSEGSLFQGSNLEKEAARTRVIRTTYLKHTNVYNKEFISPLFDINRFGKLYSRTQ